MMLPAKVYLSYVLNDKNIFVYKKDGVCYAYSGDKIAGVSEDISELDKVLDALAFADETQSPVEKEMLDIALDNLLDWAQNVDFGAPPVDMFDAERAVICVVGEL